MGRFFTGDIHLILDGFIFDSDIVAWDFHEQDHSKN